ncbi:MAG: hypothetical protein U1D55_15040 [Phycisphaerae bacterium]
MADKPMDERAVQAMLQKLKAYTSYKTHQMQSAGAAMNLDTDLQTIDIWSDDLDDSGKAWGQQRQADADQKLADAQQARAQVKADQEQAAKDAEFRNKLDMNQVKADLKKQLADHQEIMKQLADANQPGFKGKLVEVKSEVAEANEFIDKDLEKSMDLVAQKQAEQRKRRELISQKLDERALAAKQWKQEYATSPEKYPAGQQADVLKALENIEKWADAKANELQPYAARAASVIDSLKKDQAWAGGFKAQVSAQGPSLRAAKASAKPAVAHVRTSIAQAESFQGTIESEANEASEMYAKWTDRNNEMAKQWINSDNPKLREWAQEWIQTQEA